MKYKLVSAAALLLFIVFFTYPFNQKKSVKNLYRDAPSDFSDIDVKSIDSQNFMVPDPVPSKADNTQSGHIQIQKAAIYGDNTMRDYYNVDKSLQQLADSVVAIVKKSDLIFDNDSMTYKALKLKVARDEMNLSASADFADQKTLSFCSGSLVAPDLVLTAGHCVSEDPKDFTYYKDSYIIFGWKQTGAGQYNTTFTKDQVFSIERLVVHKLADAGKMDDQDLYQDYALVKLDKIAQGKEPLVIDRTGKFLVEGNKVFLAGYPMGMSLKITDPNDASIQQIGENIFSTDLDSFGGNSGGPVFDSYTRRIIGVVVTGNAKQFKYTLMNNVSLRFKINKATKDSLILKADKAGLFLEVSQNIVDKIIDNITYDGAVVNKAAGKITFPKGLIYYNNNPISNLIRAVSKKGDVWGELVKFPAYEGIGTGVQRIDSLLEDLIPLTDFEKKICRSISAKMRSSADVIDPKFMMLFELNRCNKNKES